MSPAFFVQKRVGKCLVFKFYKFRSMRVDAEEIKRLMEHNNSRTGGMFKMDNDPRVTIRLDVLSKEFGRALNFIMFWLRELIGTRPPTRWISKLYAWVKRRLSFKPGIMVASGQWSKAITDFDEVVKLDLAYMVDHFMTLRFCSNHKVRFRKKVLSRSAFLWAIIYIWGINEEKLYIL